MNVTDYTTLETAAAKLPKGGKILFACVPADGHFNPLTGLAVHLKNLGYDVRWYTSNTYADKIKKLGIRHYPFNIALDISGINIEEVFPERNKLKSGVAKLKYDLINAFILRSTEYYADIRTIHQSFPFDLMIADVMFTAIPLVKEHMKIPTIGIGVVPVAETSKDLPPMGLGMTPSNTFFGKAKQAFLRFMANEVLLKAPFNVMKTVYGQYNIQPNGNMFDTITRKATLVLQSGVPGFEYQRSDLSKNLRFVGPLLPHQKTKTNKWFNDKLTAYEKVILVTQGTVEKDVEKLIVPTLEAYQNTDRLVVVTTGGSQTEALRDRYTAPNVIIEDFIPFEDIMPYADVYVTNGGYGGVLLSIQNGLPLVVAGVNEGKNEINARVGYFGLGINLNTELPKPDALKKAVETVMSNNDYEANVAKLQEEFKQYNPNELCTQYVEAILRTAPKKEKRAAEMAIY